MVADRSPLWHVGVPPRIIVPVQALEILNVCDNVQCGFWSVRHLLMRGAREKAILTNLQHILVILKGDFGFKSAELYGLN